MFREKENDGNTVFGVLLSKRGLFSVLFFFLVKKLPSD